MLKIIAQSFKMSLQNIVANKMRSFLTMLGILIGVAAVISLMTVVEMVTNSVMGQFDSLGADTITVSISGNVLKSGLTDSDLDELREVEGVEGISPSVTASAAAVKNGSVYDMISVSGKDAYYFLYNDVVGSGRALNNADMDGHTNVCIVDSTFIENVMEGNSNCIGETFLLYGSTYTIVGIQAEDDSLYSAMSDNSNLDGSVIIPYKNALRMTRSGYVTSFEVYILDNYDNDTVEDNLRVVLDNLFNDSDDAYSIINMSSLSETMDSVENMLSLMLGGIASIALLVGGIGIMNMMLVSVSERRQEIGLRKALGAQPYRIQMQFLVEAICLSLMGGILGVLTGALISYIASIFLETTYEISSTAVALGMGFSAAVGIIFGWTPARKASRLNPIDALRAD